MALAWRALVTTMNASTVMLSTFCLTYAVPV
jgi:hypothetical protein